MLPKEKRSIGDEAIELEDMEQNILTTEQLDPRKRASSMKAPLKRDHFVSPCLTADEKVVK